MTTNSWLVDIDLVTDPVPGYKKFITDFSLAMDQVGFNRVTTAGDINIPGITVIPSGYTYTAGHEIRYLDDGLHTSAPIYLKLQYGRGGIPSSPLIGVTAGTGYDASGNLTGVFLPLTQFYLGNINVNNFTNLKCYSCQIEGCSWLVFGEGLAQNKNPASNSTQGFTIGVFRTTDATGQPTADGAAIYLVKANARGFNANTRSFKANWISADSSGSSDSVGNNGSYAPRVLGLTESVTGDLKKQVIPHILPFPELQVMTQICSLLPGDNIASGTQFNAAIKGVEERNYIAVHGARDRSGEVIALIWE